MAGRKTFTSGEILTAADVNSFLMDQSVMVFDDDSARGSAIPSPSEGMTTYLKDVDQVQVYNGSSFTPVGSVLQVIRATDSTNRSTTSTSFIDASISVTITPNSASSNVLLIWSTSVVHVDSSGNIRLAITDSSNNAIQGAEEAQLTVAAGNHSSLLTLLGWVSSGTTASRTYKGRFLSLTGGTVSIRNGAVTGQLYAIEVAG